MIDDITKDEKPDDRLGSAIWQGRYWLSLPFGTLTLLGIVITSVVAVVAVLLALAAIVIVVAVVGVPTLLAFLIGIEIGPFSTDDGS